MTRRLLMTFVIAVATVLMPAAQRSVGAAAPTIIDLGPERVALAINSRGVVVGESFPPRFGFFRWRDGRMVLIGDQGVGAHRPVAINRSGVMAVGTAWDTAIRYDAGVVTDLGSLSKPGAETAAEDINDQGVIVGASNAGGFYHAFLWRNGRMRDLGTLGGLHSWAKAINDRGQILGWSETRAGGGHIFVWQNGQMKDLGPLAPSGVDPADINDAGQIVGTLATAEGYGSRGFVWANGVLTVLPPLPGHSNSRATAINDKGEIVGVSEESTGPDHAVLWSDGKVLELPGLGGPFTEAVDISDNGMIAGNALHLDGTYRAVVWTR